MLRNHLLLKHTLKIENFKKTILNYSTFLPLKMISVSQHCCTRAKRSIFRPNTNNYFNNSKNLCSTYYVPGLVLSGFTYYPYFTSEETKAERGVVTRPRLRSETDSSPFQSYHVVILPFLAWEGLRRPKFKAGSATYQLDDTVKVT